MKIRNKNTHISYQKMDFKEERDMNRTSKLQKLIINILWKSKRRFCFHRIRQDDTLKKKKKRGMIGG